MKYRARNTFGTGKQNFIRGRIYTDIPKEHIGYFQEIPEEREEKEIEGIKIETAAAKPIIQKIQKRKKGKK
jgi:hypothetical protein